MVTKKPKKYLLTPSRKGLGKAVAHGSKESVEKRCLEDPITNKYLFEFIGLKLRRELRSMVSDSTNSLLQSKSAEDMNLFSWSRVLEELAQHAPTLLFILRACVKTKTVKKATTSIIGACAVILLKQRYNKMSMFQEIIAIVLYAEHTYKQLVDNSTCM